MATNDELQKLCEQLGLTHLTKRDFSEDGREKTDYLKQILEYELKERYTPKRYDHVLFPQLKKIMEDVITQLEEIAENMSRYKKIDTDLRAIGLINEINDKIKNIKLFANLYSNPKMLETYKNEDFSEYANQISAYVTEYQKGYERIKKFENVLKYC